MLIRKVSFILISIIIALIIMLAAPILILQSMGYAPMAILSGSMEPAYQTGGLIFLDTHVAAEDIKVGDAIAFYRGESTVVTHRVISIDRENGTFTTQGDANNVADAPVSYDRLVGRVWFYLPLLGFLLMDLNSSKGLAYGIILVGVLALLFVAAAVAPYFARDDEEPDEQAAKEQGAVGYPAGMPTGMPVGVPGVPGVPVGMPGYPGGLPYGAALPLGMLPPAGQASVMAVQIASFAAQSAALAEFMSSFTAQVSMLAERLTTIEKQAAVAGTPAPEAAVATAEPADATEAAAVDAAAATPVVSESASVAAVAVTLPQGAAKEPVIEASDAHSTADDRAFMPEDADIAPEEAIIAAVDAIIATEDQALMPEESDITTKESVATSDDRAFMPEDTDISTKESIVTADDTDITAKEAVITGDDTGDESMEPPPDGKLTVIPITAPVTPSKSSSLFVKLTSVFHKRSTRSASLPSQMENEEPESDLAEKTKIVGE